MTGNRWRYECLLKELEFKTNQDFAINFRDGIVELIGNVDNKQDIIPIIQKHLTEPEIDVLCILPPDTKDANRGLRLGHLGKPIGKYSNRKVLSHNDLDGYGTNVLFSFSQMAADISNLSNDEVDEAVLSVLDEEYSELIMTDISVSEDIVPNINSSIQKGLKVGLFDHHKTAIHLDKEEWATIDLSGEHSGTSLLFEYMRKTVPHRVCHRPLQQFVQLVKDYDTWNWTENGNTMARDLNDLFYFYLYKPQFVEEMVSHLWSLKRDEDFKFSESQLKQIKEVQDDKAQYIQKHMHQVKRCKIPMLDDLYQKEISLGIVRTSGLYTSLLGHSILDDYKDLDMVAIYSGDFEEPYNIKVSLRSKNGGNTDVSILAKHMNGGGHKHAGGFTLKDKNVIERIKGIL